ncbi:MAG: adenylate/guanylate cyclase domain-containing protein, partial [Spirochaetales bacterium]
MSIPTGTVTFLFTDIEGSTRMWERRREAMQEALKRHDTILRLTIESHRGYVFKTVGDAFCAAFTTATDALESAVEIQRKIDKTDWGEAPIRIRMGMHTGTAEERDGDYFGRAVNRVARLQSAGHGGQVLVSSSTQELLADNLPEHIVLKDLGSRRLKDLDRPEHIYQAQIGGKEEQFPQLKTLDIRPNNLPVQVTSFIGREKEIDEIHRLLNAARLLTINCPGGIGKTRISLHATTELLDIFHDGVWFIDLVPVSGKDGMWQAVAGALSIRSETGIPLDNTVIDRLKNKELLLILDNCEQLVLEAAETAGALLAGCPDIKILATSREALSIPGETVYQIQPLSVPSAAEETQGEKSCAAGISEYESVRLFIDRALQIRQTFVVTNENAPALAQICRWLDGIPLAIELAASRVKMFSLKELYERLGDRFEALNRGLRTAPPRQQTLRALIDWSYDLLDEEERELFMKLSVFTGGWALKAAEVICGSTAPLPVTAPPAWRDFIDPDHNYTYKTEGSIATYNDIKPDLDVIGLLERLVDKSLVIANQTDGSTRFVMLETVRQYGEQKLNDSGKSRETLKRHLHYFLLFVENYMTQVEDVTQNIWDTPIREEYPNIQTALKISLTEKEYYEYGVRIISSLFTYWQYHGSEMEARVWLEQFYPFPDYIQDPLTRTWITLMFGWILSSTLD